MPGNYIVRYGTTRNVAEFSYRGQQDLKRTMSVLIRSDRGVEWGEVLCEATDRTKEYLGGSDQAGRILRTADDEAWKKREEVRLTEREVFAGGRELIAEHKLNMQLVDVEKLFGGERIIFYYLAEQRVDFRELVKSLARKFHTRIEMRQIGVRDEARLLADYGDCGKPVCCGTHLREMPPVSMKMAKLQKATLDPNKISGRCGRLKCCLRYEYDTYEEYRRELPSQGATVITKQGQGRVISQEILARKLLVDFEGGRRTMIDESEVVTVVKSSRNASSDNPKKGKKGRGNRSRDNRQSSDEKPVSTKPEAEAKASSGENGESENRNAPENSETKQSPERLPEADNG